MDIKNGKDLIGKIRPFFFERKAESFQAAEEAYMDLTEMQSLLPNNLIVEMRQGSVNAVNADTGQTKTIYPEPRTLFLKSQDK